MNRHILELSNSHKNVLVTGSTSEAISVLVNYEWPLNYEQLKQVV